MSFSYDVTSLTVELNKIRLYIGDTDSSDFFLHDEEIISVQADITGFKATVAACCRLICSKLARKVDYKLSLLSEKASAVYKRYKEMAERYEVMSSVSYPWSGAIYADDKKATEDDTSLVKPKFKKGIMDHSGTVVTDDDNI